jgi:hypothetical protein
MERRGVKENTRMGIEMDYGFFVCGIMGRFG